MGIKGNFLQHQQKFCQTQSTTDRIHSKYGYVVMNYHLGVQWKTLFE